MNGFSCPLLPTGSDLAFFSPHIGSLLEPGREVQSKICSISGVAIHQERFHRIESSDRHKILAIRKNIY